MDGDVPPEIRITPVNGLPEIEPGFELGGGIAGLIDLTTEDIVVVSQKAVSKVEGRVVDLASVTAGREATDLAIRLRKDPRMVELILRESRQVIRSDPERGILITETNHGFVCANAGIDASNLDRPDAVVLLPKDCDHAARVIRAEIEDETGNRPGVVISDSFGRPWRYGQFEVALGTAGVEVLDDWRGIHDRNGRVLTATTIAAADQIAAAADLARSKTSGTP
ncbi:MAG: coenzyme F420-0:L-glutamate ligase, partial [Dehalococcoidia bacterium]|nr:coenzyme F420-0:L-glutamate ligase [Dehalococcoidia bacterium]